MSDVTDIEIQVEDLKLEGESETSNKVPQKEFFQIVAQFIEQANEAQSQFPPEMVSTALIYAASRYNTYIVARSSDNQEAFDKERHRALNYFTEQYQAMFKENFADYAERYNEFLPNK